MTCVNNGVYRPRVLYGDLDLTDDTGDYRLEWGYRFGNGVVVYDEIESLLRDGTLVASTKTGNRELLLSVLVKGAGSQARADAGALLDEEVNKQINTVTVYPADYGQPGAGPPLVLETFEAQSNHDWDGDLERGGYRRFELNIPALPGIRSLDPVVVNWSGPGAVLRATSSTSGWTLRNAGTLTTSGGFLTRTTAGPMQLRTTPTAPLKQFIYIRSNAVGTVSPDVVIGGVAIPNAQVFLSPAPNNADVMIIEVPEQFIGTQPQIDFDVEVSSGTAVLYGFGTTDYPTLPPGAEPGAVGISPADAFPGANRGIGVIDVIGTARTFCTIQFTAPAGGAIVITGRDPVHALRERGLAEMAFGKFTVASANGATISIPPGAMWFPQGTHYAQVGRTNPQPPALFPNGVWPTLATGVTTLGGDAAASQWVYPADEMAQVSFFATTGAKTLISAQQDLPEGYTGGAEVFEDHILHPGRTMFAVLDTSGNPIAATVTYYPRWKHYPTQ